MSILIKLTLFFTLFYFAHSGLTDVKIYINTVPKNIETHIFAYIFSYLQKYDNMTEIGQLLVVDLNNNYGKGWYALAGANGTFDNITFKSEQNTSFWFSYYDEHFFLYKPSIDLIDFADVIRGALVSGIILGQNYALTAAQVTVANTWITEALNHAISCTGTALSSTYGDSACYRQITNYLKLKVASTSPWTSYNWTILVGERYALSADFQNENYHTTFTAGNLIIVFMRIC